MSEVEDNSPKLLSREFLLERGFCCNMGCQNCPYGEEQDQLREDEPA